MKKRILRLTALLCALVLLVCVMPAIPVAARDLKDIQNEISDKRAYMEELEKSIEANQANKAAAERALKEYEEQYNMLVALIDEQEETIRGTEADLEQKTKELTATIESIRQNKDLYIERLRAIYDMNSSNAAASAIFTVTSFTEMLQVGDALQRIGQRDTQLLANLAEEKATYERQQADLETAIEEMTARLAELQENRDWADEQVTKMENNIYSYNVNIKAGESKMEFTQEEIDELVAEYNRIFKELQEKASKEGDGSTRYNGPLTWPVPSSGRITSYFGDPRSNTGYHYGIDIAAPESTPIVAAAPGKVITATWHYSYGNYIVIDHGGGLRTLYAHCVALYVGVGTSVEAGMTIAGVGNTGNSFGNHLHFEVHDKGGRQNPLGSGYLNP